MAAEILARIGAVAGEMQRLPAAGSDVRAARATAHYDGLRLFLMGPGVAAPRAELAGVLAEIWALPFTRAQNSELVDVLLNKTKRGALQDYEESIHYFTDERWQVLLDPAADQFTKGRVIEDTVVGLCGRNLSEGTWARLAALLSMCLTRGEMRSSPSTLRALFLAMKKSFAKFKKSPVRAKLDVLPADPQVFMANHPAEYAALYTAASPPVPCKLNMSDLQHVVSLIRQRARDPNPSSALAAYSGQPASLADGGAMQMCQQILQQQMAAMMQQAFGARMGAMGGGGGGRDVLGLEILTPPPRRTRSRSALDSVGTEDLEDDVACEGRPLAVVPAQGRISPLRWRTLEQQPGHEEGSRVLAPTQHCSSQLEARNREPHRVEDQALAEEATGAAPETAAAQAHGSESAQAGKGTAGAPAQAVCRALSAMEARSAQRKIEAAAAKAEAAAAQAAAKAVAAAKAAAGAAAGGDAGPVTPIFRRKRVKGPWPEAVPEAKKPRGADDDTPPNQDPPTGALPLVSPPKKKAKKKLLLAPSVNHEASRKQFLFRPGTHGRGGSTAIKYTDEHGSMQAAKARAEQMVRDELARRLSE